MKNKIMNMMKLKKKKRITFLCFWKLIKFGLYFLEIYGNPLGQINV